MDLTSMLGPAASVITAIGALPLAGLLQNRREARVRTSIADSLHTIGAIGGAKLANEKVLTARLEDALQSDIDALGKFIESRNQEKKRNWASLFVAIFVAAVVTIPLWFLWRPENWWTWTVFISLVTAAALLMIGGLGACFNPTEKERPQSE